MAIGTGAVWGTGTIPSIIVPVLVFHIRLKGILQRCGFIVFYIRFSVYHHSAKETTIMVTFTLKIFVYSVPFSFQSMPKDMQLPARQ
jgi:hypothetical protein